MLGEGVDARFGFRPSWRTVDFAQVRFHIDLDRGSDLVEHVDGFVHPTALVAGAREDLLERLPQAETAVANGEVWSNCEPSPLDIDEQFPPALRAFAYADLEADQLFATLRRCPDHDQYALGMRLHACLQVNPVRPDVDIAPSREVALLPRIVFHLPLGRQAGDHRR